MTDFDTTIAFLKTKGIESFELMNILVIPVTSCEHLDQVAKDIKRLLNEVGYEKSWRLDPYFYEKRQTIEAEMYQ